GLQLQRALRFGAGLDAGERFGLLVRLSRALNFEGRMEEALRAATDAVAIAEHQLGADAHGRALNVLAAALWSLDRVVGARADARAAGLHVQTIRAFVNSVVVAADAREHATVDALVADALRVFDDYQVVIPRDAVLIAVARSLLDRGRWDDALEHAARGR